MKPFTTIAAVLFAAIAAVHLFRLIDPFAVEIAGNPVPQSVSVAALVLAGLLAAMLWREARR